MCEKAYQDLSKKLDLQEIKYFQKINTGTIHERCVELEKHKNLFIFHNIIDNSNIRDCILEEEMFTALSLRVYYIENGINITENMNQKLNQIVKIF